jgi:putative nucleotidyltransferase with HDIG domain
MSLTYRIQQFFRTLRARPEAIQIARVMEILDPPLSKLFFRMPPSDQAHSLRVLSALQREGHTDADLLAAALLHDVGKSVHRPTVFDRIVVVLANQIIPRRVVKWGGAKPQGWRRPFVIVTQHARWGADLVAQHNASPRLVELIRRHQDPLPVTPSTPVDLLLVELRRVDSEN